jgi:hypothetical protein
VKTPMLSWPTRTNQSPRHIPPAQPTAHPYVLDAAAGILPFCTIYVELIFAMMSMWQGYFYNLFGFLFIVVVLTVLITVEVSILCTCANPQPVLEQCSLDTWLSLSARHGGSVLAEDKRQGTFSVLPPCPSPSLCIHCFRVRPARAT